MKLQVFFILSSIFILYSCSNKVESINVKSLKTPCECAEAAEIVLTERLDIEEESIGKDVKDIDTAKMIKRVKIYFEKEEEIKKHCKDKLAIGKCPEWKEIKEKLTQRGDDINKKRQEEALKKVAN